MFLIKRLDQGGGYVNKPGSQAAYTTSILRARKFDTEEDAQADCCGNEMPINYEQLLAQYN